MAKAATKIDADKHYRVDLNHSIRVGRMPVHPGPNTKLLGSVLQELISQDAAAVAGYEAVPAVES